MKNRIGDVAADFTSERIAALDCMAVLRPFLRARLQPR